MATTLYPSATLFPGVVVPSAAQSAWGQTTGTSGFGPASCFGVLAAAGSNPQITDTSGKTGSGSVGMYAFCTQPILGDTSITGSWGAGFFLNIVAGTWNGVASAFVMKGDGSGIRGTLFTLQAVGATGRTTHSTDDSCWSNSITASTVNALDGDFIQFEYGYTSTTISSGDAFKFSGSTATTFDQQGSSGNAAAFFTCPVTLAFYPSTQIFYLRQGENGVGPRIANGALGTWTRKIGFFGTNGLNAETVSGTSQIGNSSASTGTGTTLLLQCNTRALAAQTFNTQALMSVGWAMACSVSRSVQAYLFVGIVESDGLTLRGTIRATAAIDSAGAISTSELTVFSSSMGSSTQITCQAGDRLVFEMGITGFASTTYTMYTDGTGAITSGRSSTSNAQSAIAFFTNVSLLPPNTFYPRQDEGTLGTLPTVVDTGWDISVGSYTKANAKRLDLIAGTTQQTASGTFNSTDGDVAIISFVSDRLRWQKMATGNWTFAFAWSSSSVQSTAWVAHALYVIKADGTQDAVAIGGVNFVQGSPTSETGLLFTANVGQFEIMQDERLVWELGIQVGASNGITYNIFTGGTSTIVNNATIASAKAFLTPASYLWLQPYISNTKALTAATMKPSGSTVKKTVNHHLSGVVTSAGSFARSVAHFVHLFGSLMVQNPVTDGLQAHWKFDEGSGTTVADSSGNGYTGTVVGTHLTWGPGILGSSISLPGDSQLSYVSTGFPEIDLDYSVSAWVYLLDSRTATIVGEDGAHGGVSLITLLDDHTVLVRDVNNTGNTYTIPTLAKNVWHHIVISQTGSDQHCYADNAESSTGVLSALGAMLLDFIGYNDNSNSWYGGLDEIAYYDRGITPAEVAVLWNGGQGYSPGTPSVSFLYTIPYHLSLLANLVLGNTITTDTLYFRYDKPGRTSITYDRFGWDDYALAGDARALDPNPSTVGQQSASVVVANTHDTARVGQFSIPLAGSGFIPQGTWVLEFALKGTTDSFTSGVEIYVIDPAVGGSGFTFIMDRFISTNYTPDGEVTVLFVRTADQDVSYGPGSVLVVEMLVTNCTGGDTVTGYAGGTSAITDDNIPIVSALSLIISPVPIVYQAEPSNLFRLTGHRLAATVTPAATLARKVERTLTASTTLAATLVKKTAHALAASLSQSGVLTRAKTIHVSLTGSLSPLGSLLKNTSKPLTAGITSGASLVRSTKHNLAASSSPAGALTRRATRAFTATVQGSATLFKITNKLLSGSSSPSGSLSTPRTILKTLAGSLAVAGSLATQFISGVQTYMVSLTASLAPSGSLLRLTGHALVASCSSAGSLIKQTSHNLAASSTFAGSLARAAIRAVGLAGSLTGTGSLLKTTKKTLAGSITTTAVISRSMSRIFVSTVQASGSLIKLTSRTMNAALSSSSVLLKRVSRSFAGSTSFSGVLSRTMSHVLSGTITQAGSLAKSTHHALSATVQLSGSLIAAIAHLLTLLATVTGTAALTKKATHALTASATAAGSLLKQTRKSVAGTLALSGSLLSIRTFLVALASSITLAALLTKRTSKPLAATVQATGSLIKKVTKILFGFSTFSGALQSTRVVLLTLTAAITASASLVRRTLHFLSGTVTALGSVLKRSGHASSSTMSPSGGLIKRVNKLLNGSTTGSGSLSTLKAILRSLAGSVSAVGSLKRSVGHVMNALVQPSATLHKFVSLALTALLTPSGFLDAFIKSVFRYITSVLHNAESVVSRLVTGGLRGLGLSSGSKRTSTLTQRQTIESCVNDTSPTSELE